MAKSERASVGDDYVLATGDEGVARLHLLDEVYGASSRAACAAAGLGDGWRVADLGCGVGDMSCWLGERVGPHGGVIAMDVSADQLVHARERAARSGLGNVFFVEGSAYEPGLPPGELDLVFCRFLLCHLQRPADALAQMAALLRPGGTLVAQDMVMTSSSATRRAAPTGASPSSASRWARHSGWTTTSGGGRSACSATSASPT